MKLYNDEFKRAYKAYKAIKDAEFILIDGKVLVKNEEVEVKFRVGSFSKEPVVIDSETLKLMSRVHDDFVITPTEIRTETKRIEYAASSATESLCVRDDSYVVAEISQKGLLACIKGVKFAVSTGDTTTTPVVHKNILWEEGKFVATDGYRIAIKHASVCTETELLIPPIAFNALEKLLDKKSKSWVLISVGSEEMIFDFGTVSIITKRPTGEFLKYKSVFTDEYEIECEVDRKLFLEKIKYLQQDKETKICVDVTVNKLSLMSKTPNNTLTDEIEINTLRGNELSINFNSKYLIESLKNIPDDKITLTFVGGSVQPLIIKHSCGKDLILPTRIKG